MKKPACIRNVLSAAKSSRHNLGSLKDSFLARLASFRSHRSTREQEEMRVDFGRVLSAWGIDDEDDIPCAITVLRIRQAIFAVCALVCLFVACLQRGFVSWLALALVASPCVFGLITAMWRIAILRRKKFTPFLTWLAHPRWLA